MTAASAFPPEASEGRPAEPSMEDILASIRRIIADDQNQGGKAAASGNGVLRPNPPPPEADRAVARTRTPYDDVLDLARLVPAGRRTPDEPSPSAAMPLPSAVQNGSVPERTVPVEDEEDRPEEHDAGSPSTVSGLRARLPEPVSHGASEDEGYERSGHPVPALSGGSEDDLLSAHLGESVMSAFETLAATVVLQNTPMLERVMRDLLRPMLKTWLDDNLPTLVERLVRSEIERVARGTRG